MKAVTSAQMRELDQKAIREYGIPSLILMENAGRGVAELIFNAFKGKRRVTVFAGKGNNGGDGLAAARHLWNRGVAVEVLLFADPARLKDDPALNFEIVSRMKIPVSLVTDQTPAGFFFTQLSNTELVIDALFGVGLHAPLTGIFYAAVSSISQSGRPAVAVDIPSGLDSDTGEVLGVAVKAVVTATLGLPKTGLFQKAGPEHAGKICVVDIGIPRQALEGLP